MDHSNDNLRDIIPEWFCFLPNNLKYTDHPCCEDHGDKSNPQEKSNPQYKAKYFCLDCKKGCLCMTCFEAGYFHHAHKNIHIYKVSDRPTIKALNKDGHLNQILLEPFYRALHELSTYSWNKKFHYFLAPPKECKQAKINICCTCGRKETSGEHFKYCSIKCLVDSTLSIRPITSIPIYEIIRKSNLKKTLKNKAHEGVVDLQTSHLESSSIVDEYKHLSDLHTLVCKMEECIEVNENHQQHDVSTLDGDNKIEEELNECEVFKNFYKAFEFCKKSHELKQTQLLASSSESSDLMIKSVTTHTNNQDQTSLSENYQAKRNNIRTLNMIQTFKSRILSILHEANDKHALDDIEYEIRRKTKSNLLISKKPKLR